MIPPRDWRGVYIFSAMIIYRLINGILCGLITGKKEWPIPSPLPISIYLELYAYFKESAFLWPQMKPGINLVLSA